MLKQNRKLGRDLEFPPCYGLDINYGIYFLFLLFIFLYTTLFFMLKNVCIKYLYLFKDRHCIPRESADDQPSIKNEGQWAKYIDLMICNHSRP